MWEELFWELLATHLSYQGLVLTPSMPIPHLLFSTGIFKFLDSSSSTYKLSFLC